MKKMFEIFAAYHPGRDRVGSIDTVTIHGSAGGDNANALIRWWKNLPLVTDKWSKDKVQRLKNGIGFYHFLVDRDGTLYGLLDEKKWSYHAHAGKSDQSTIAVCLVNTEKGNASSYTELQYFTLHDLISELVKRYPTIKKIDSHDNRAMTFSRMKTDPPCPGPLMDWERIKVHGLEICP